MKIILLYAGCLLFFFSANAQVEEQKLNQKKEEKIKALYIAYMSEQLKLSPEEAQKFWPMHAQYEADLKAINNGNTDELSRQQAVLNVKKKYQAGFSRLLGAERSDNFYRQDNEFRKKLLERLRQMRQQRNNNNANGEGRLKKLRPN